MYLIKMSMDDIHIHVLTESKSEYKIKSAKDVVKTIIDHKPKLVKPSDYVIQHTFEDEFESYISVKNKKTERIGLVNKNFNLVIPDIFTNIDFDVESGKLIIEYMYEDFIVNIMDFSKKLYKRLLK